MADQPKLEQNEATALLPDATAAQPIPNGTIPRDGPWADPAFVSGVDTSGRWLEQLPFSLDEETLGAGRERFTVYCAVCHGPDGYGDGIVARRGFPPPPSYHSERLRGAPVGYLFDVISRGYGAMPAFDERLPPRQRWEIAAYLRTLQWSQHPRAAVFSDKDFAAHSPTPPER